MQAYISGNALIILGGPRHIIQTIYTEDEGNLVSVVLDEPSGKIATASAKAIYVYKPHGLDIGQPNVRQLCPAPPRIECLTMRFRSGPSNTP